MDNSLALPFASDGGNVPRHGIEVSCLCLDDSNSYNWRCYGCIEGGAASSENREVAAK